MNVIPSCPACLTLSFTVTRDASTQVLMLDRVAGTTELAANVRQSIRKAHDLEDSLEELDDLADEEERDRIQALCDSV